MNDITGVTSSTSSLQLGNGQKTEGKSGKEKVTDHSVPPHENKKHEDLFDKLYAEQLVNQKISTSSQETTGPLAAGNLPQLRILRERPEETPGWMSRILSHLFFWKRVSEDELESFRLRTDDKIVARLLKGDLDSYETRRVLDRVRVFCVYGNERERKSAREVMRQVRNVLARKPGHFLFDRFTSGYKAARKIREYYTGVQQKLSQTVDQFLQCADRIAPQLSVDDRIILLDDRIKGSSALKKLLSKEMYDLTILASTDDIEYNKLIQLGEKTIRESTKEYRRKVDAYFETSEATLDENSSGEEIKAFAKHYDEKSINNLHALLNRINEKLCDDPKDKWAINTLKLLRKEIKDRYVITKYCLDRLERSMTARESYEKPDFCETVSLPGILCRRMLLLACLNLDAKGTAGNMSVMVEARCGPGAGNYFLDVWSDAHQALHSYLRDNR